MFEKNNGNSDGYGVVTDKICKLRVQIVQFDENSKCFEKGAFVKVIGRFIDVSNNTHFSATNTDQITLLEDPKMNIKEDHYTYNNKLSNPFKNT